MNPMHEWSQEIDFPVTICNPDGIIVAMNKKSIELFEEDGGSALIGRSLMDCHPEPARQMLVEMLKNRTPHTYISTSNGQKQFVHETPWYVNGEYRGFVEMLIPFPES